MPKSHRPQLCLCLSYGAYCPELVSTDDSAHQRLEGYTKRHKDDSFALMMLAWSHRQRKEFDQERAARVRIPSHRRGAYDFFIDRAPEDQLGLINTYLSDSCHQNRLPDARRFPILLQITLLLNNWPGPLIVKIASRPGFNSRLS